MQRTKFVSETEPFIRSESERSTLATAERYMRKVGELPAYQTRTCAHCGARTTFTLQDRAGWYACSECERYA